MRISKSDLYEKYDITLPHGKYQIYTRNNNYEIYTVKDDTEGCILVGKPYRADFITDSRKTYTELFKRINDALTDRQIVTIEIT